MTTREENQALAVEVLKEAMRIACEFGFKSAEQGHNREYTRQRLEALMSDYAGPKPC